MAQIEADHENTYHIRLKGILEHSIANWFGNITILPQENDETLLIGQFADQPALRGFLDQLWNLNFTILSIELIENRKVPKEPFEEGEK